MNYHLNKRNIGNIGEDIACRYLQGRGFTIVTRNYLRKWGEIDIIAQKDNLLHFIEVKSVTGDFSREMGSRKPEDNVHPLKTRKIRRMVETYLSDMKKGDQRVGPTEAQETEFQFDVISVYMNNKTRRARVIMMENLIL